MNKDIRVFDFWYFLNSVHFLLFKVDQIFIRAAYSIRNSDLLEF
jgi:hypothetical protein